jgi:hypothetical protein
LPDRASLSLAIASLEKLRRDAVPVGGTLVVTADPHELIDIGISRADIPLSAWDRRVLLSYQVEVLSLRSYMTLCPDPIDRDEVIQ